MRRPWLRHFGDLQDTLRLAHSSTACLMDSRDDCCLLARGLSGDSTSYRIGRLFPLWRINLFASRRSRVLELLILYHPAELAANHSICSAHRRTDHHITQPECHISDSAHHPLIPHHQPKLNRQKTAKHVLAHHWQFDRLNNSPSTSAAMGG